MGLHNGFLGPGVLEVETVSAADNAIDLSKTGITWAEARQLTLESGRRADEERAKRVQTEANRGIQYKDQEVYDGDGGTADA